MKKINLTQKLKKRDVYFSSILDEKSMSALLGGTNFGCSGDQTNLLHPTCNCYSLTVGGDTYECKNGAVLKLNN